MNTEIYASAVLSESVAHGGEKVSTNAPVKGATTSMFGTTHCAKFQLTRP